MYNTVRAVVRGGKIEFMEKVGLSDGTKVLVTFLHDEDTRFWLDASQAALDAIWDNAEDDVYVQLLEK